MLPEIPTLPLLETYAILSTTATSFNTILSQEVRQNRFQTETAIQITAILSPEIRWWRRQARVWPYPYLAPVLLYAGMRRVSPYKDIYSVLLNPLEIRGWLERTCAHQKASQYGDWITDFYHKLDAWRVLPLLPESAPLVLQWSRMAGADDIEPFWAFFPLSGDRHA